MAKTKKKNETKWKFYRKMSFPHSLFTHNDTSPSERHTVQLGEFAPSQLFLVFEILNHFMIRIVVPLPLLQIAAILGHSCLNRLRQLFRLSGRLPQDKGESSERVQSGERRFSDSYVIAQGKTYGNCAIRGTDRPFLKGDRNNLNTFRKVDPRRNGLRTQWPVLFKQTEQQVPVVGKSDGGQSYKQ